MSKRLLQAAVSRDKSLAYRISDTAWKNGLETFYMEGVPLSLFTGKWFAGQCGALYQALAKRFGRDQRHKLVEYGAGTGMFSKHLLDCLSLDKGLYERTSVAVTDYAEASIKTLRESGQFKAFEGHVSCYPLDVLNSDLSEGIQPLLGFLILLLDSLPARHLVVDNGVLQEVVVKTFVSEDVRVLDTRKLPFKTLGYEDVQAFVREQDYEALTHFYPQLAPFLSEEFEKVSVSGLAHQDFLEDFIQDLDSCQPVYFNYSASALEMLRQLIQTIPNGGGLVVGDFGFTHFYDTSIDRLTQSYGAVRCFGLPFPLVRQFCESEGVSTFLTREPTQAGQVLFLYKGTDVVAVRDTFESLFLDFPAVLLTEKRQQLRQFKGTDAAFLELISDTLSRLSLPLNEDYFLLLNCGIECYERQLLSAACGFFEQATALYRHVDIEGRLYASFAYCQLGDYEKAGDILRECREIAPHVAAVHNQSSIVFGRLKDTEKQFEETMMYFQTYREYMIWQQVVNLVLFLTMKDRKREADELVVWSLELADMPGEIKDQLRQVRQQYLA